TARLCWLALVSILRVTSPVGTAQWQYILPRKSKARAADPLLAYAELIEMMAMDMLYRQAQPHGPRGVLQADDARECSTVPSAWADLVVTSRPYANNYDYADATRLEMTFLGEISGWGDLQDSIRSRLLRSCTQHVSRYADKTAAVVSDPLLAPIKHELAPTCA